MTKLELINAIAKTRNPDGLIASEVERVINAAIKIITDTLAQGGKVQLLGFGTFEVHDRAERQGRNPRTGEVITLPATKRVHFKPFKALKAAVNGGNAHDR